MGVMWRAGRVVERLARSLEDTWPLVVMGLLGGTFCLGGLLLLCLGEW